MVDDKGLYEKYRVERADGKPIKWCFVLEPENDAAARWALVEYAYSTSNVTLSQDLLKLMETKGWAEGLTRKPVRPTG